MVLLRNSVWFLHFLQGALAANIRRRESVDVTTPVSVPSTSVPAASPAPSSSSSSSSSQSFFRRPIKPRLHTSVTPSPSVSKPAATTIPRTSAPGSSSTTKSTATPTTTYIGYFYNDSESDYEGCSLTESGFTGLYSPAPSTSGQTGYQPCVYMARPTVTVGANVGPVLSTMSDGVVVSCSSATYQDYNVNNAKGCVGSTKVISTDSSMYNSYYSSSASVAASIAHAQMSAEASSASAMASPTAIVWIGETWEYKEYSTETIDWMAWVARNDNMSGYADWCDNIVSVKESNDYVQSVEGTPMPDTVSFKKSSVEALKSCTYSGPTIGQVEAGNLTCTGSDPMNIPCTTDFPTFSNYNTQKECSKKSWSIGLVLACPISESSHERINVEI